MSRPGQAVQPTSDALNRLVKTTIRDAEKVLIALSQTAELVESKPRKTEPVRHVIETSVSVSAARVRTVTMSSAGSLPLASTRSSYVNYHRREKRDFAVAMAATAVHSVVRTSSSTTSTGITKARIVPGSLRITELRSVTGINLDLNVLVNVGHGCQESTIPVSIECPNFQPKRISFNGEWRDIVAPLPSPSRQ